MSFTKYPIDIVLCIIWAIILLPITLLSMDSTVRTILGLPFILFIPGYTLIFALFPIKKGERGINELERIALSFGFSIAITSLIGLILNYTPWQIRLEPILLSLFFFIISIGSIAFYRWKKAPPDQRFILSLKTSLLKSNNTLDNALTIIVGISIIIAMASIIYVIATPKRGETFTEFYILGSGENETNYPQGLRVHENTSIIIGLVNHEYKIMNYTIEVWLINETTVFNESAQENKFIYNHMWYIDTITKVLDYSNIKQLPQWEYNYSFSINKTGNFKLAFLLFTAPTEKYSFVKDYSDITERKIQSAYKEVHLWISIE